MMRVAGGVVAGDHRVTVVALPPRDSATPPALIARKYGDPGTSGLTATVTPGTREVVLTVANPAERPAGP